MTPTFFKRKFIGILSKTLITKSRNGRLQMVSKIVVLKNFANFTGKQLCWSLFLIKNSINLNLGVLFRGSF